jgi:hypothetical protein
VYIEKTISVSFDLPTLDAGDVSTILDSFTLPVTFDDSHRRLVLAGLGTNPRRIKRFLNTLSLQLHLAELAKSQGRPVDPCLLSGGDPASFLYFLKLMLIAYRHSGVFALALEDEELLNRLQSVSNATKETKDEWTSRRKREEELNGEVILVRRLHETEEFWRLMRQPPNLLDERALVSRLRNWFRYRAPASPPVAEQTSASKP